MVRRFFVVLVVMFVGAAVSGCGLNSSGTVKDCSTLPTSPAVTLNGYGTPIIETWTISYCDVPPREHHVQVSMERLVSGDPVTGTWAPVSSVLMGGFNECSEIPTPAGTRCTFSLECEDGTYRTRVHVVWTGPDGNSGVHDESVKPVGVLRCP